MFDFGTKQEVKSVSIFSITYQRRELVMTTELVPFLYLILKKDQTEWTRLVWIKPSPKTAQL